MPAAAAGLVPHAAHYSLTLASALGGSGISSVRGDLAINWEGDCTGWTMNHLMTFDIAYQENEPLRIRMEATTWEAADSRQYSFYVRTFVNGRESERTAGRAAIDANGGKATFTAPAAKTIALSPETMFPTHHTKRLLEAARSAPRVVSATVFDGLTNEGPMLVNAVIGKQSVESGAEKAMPSELSGLAMWHVQLAYFGGNSPEAQPDSEIGFRLFRNGVIDRLKIGFDDFLLDGRLEKLRVGKEPSCAD
jgi:hypothetical protein